jgi:hypothetical protein
MDPHSALHDEIPLPIWDRKFEKKCPGIDIVDILETEGQQRLECRGQGVDVQVCEALFWHCVQGLGNPGMGDEAGREWVWEARELE